MSKKEACSLQMVIMLKWRTAKAFAKPSVHTSKAAWWVHAIMQFHSPTVGWSCFLDGDCLDASPVQIFSKCGFPSGPGLKLLLELPKSNS